MNIIQAIIYGLVQGLGEFLPISSTAHITLLPWLFGWEDPGLTFDVALHFGTAVAVIAYFFFDWLKLVRAGVTKPKSSEGRLFWLLVIATIPGGIAGVLLESKMDEIRDPIIIAISLILMGVVLYVADIVGRRNITRTEEIGAKKGILIGLSQALAIIPGVSRSGITMSAGRFLGINREAVARFSFLLSTPIILAGALFKVKDLGEVNVDILPFVVAVATSAIVGFLSIKFLLNFLKTKGFGGFAVYRFVLGTFVLIMTLFK